MYVYVKLVLLLTCGHYITETSAQCPVNNIGTCFCQNHIIDCDHAGLTVMPSFIKFANQQFTTLKLSNNNITSIPRDAFVNLNSSVLRTIILTNNSIDTFESGAFNGVYAITTLDISGNFLEGITDEIKYLHNLTSLNVMYNPLHPNGFDVLWQVGDTLKVFAFGGDYINYWPSRLHHLQALEELRFEGHNLTQLPLNAFTGFNYRLKKLTLSNTRLQQAPLALAQLDALEELYYDNNIYTGNAGMIKAAFMNPRYGTTTYGNKYLRILSLKNNGFTSYPAVISMFHQLTTVYLDNNQLWVIRDFDVEHTAGPIQSISLRNCQLYRIPNTLFRLSKLERLDLSYNKIKSIESNDFYFSLDVSRQHSPILRSIDLSHNPLAYVEEVAFNILQHLESIDLSNTQLPTVPKALMHNQALNTVYLNNTLVECTCQLRWINTDPGFKNRVHIYGDCDTISHPINDYIQNWLSLARCGPV